MSVHKILIHQSKLSWPLDSNIALNDCCAALVADVFVLWSGLFCCSFSLALLFSFRSMSRPLNGASNAFSTGFCGADGFSSSMSVTVSSKSSSSSCAEFWDKCCCVSWLGFSSTVESLNIDSTLLILDTSDSFVMGSVRYIFSHSSRSSAGAESCLERMYACIISSCSSVILSEVNECSEVFDAGSC